MPLVTCPDCNNEHSDISKECKKCGRPKNEDFANDVVVPTIKWYLFYFFVASMCWQVFDMNIANLTMNLNRCIHIMSDKEVEYYEAFLQEKSYITINQIAKVFASLIMTQMITRRIER